MIRSAPSQSNPPPQLSTALDAKAQLAAEIARIEAELEQKRADLNGAPKRKVAVVVKKNPNHLFAGGAATPQGGPVRRPVAVQSVSPPLRAAESPQNKEAWHGYYNREDDYDDEDMVSQEKQAFASASSAPKERGDWHDYPSQEESIRFDLQASYAEEMILQEEQAFVAASRAQKEQEMLQQQRFEYEQQALAEQNKRKQEEAALERKRMIQQEEAEKKRIEVALQRQQLEAQMKRIEADLARQKLEAEIKAMEAAILAAAQQKRPKKASPAKSTSRAIQHKAPMVQKQPAVAHPLSVTQAAAQCQSFEEVEPTPVPQTPAPTPATPATGRASFLASITQAAAQRQAIQSVKPTLVTEAEAPAPAATATSRAGFLGSIVKAAAQRQAAEEIVTTTTQGVERRAVAPTDKTEGILISSAAPPSFPPQNPLLAAISQAAIAREERFEQTDGELITREVDDVANTLEHNGRQNFLAALVGAATAREQRLEETGGELIMQEFAPEVKAQAASSPQLSFSLAEMITKRATEREKRLEAGGEKKMTVIKEKAEYKKDFSNIVIDAAAMGRLTRLEEEVVEAVAGAKTQEEEWYSKGLLAIDWRKNHMSVIHEAAQLGAQIKMPETVVTNGVHEEEHWDLLEEKPMSQRKRQLLEMNTKVGEGQHKVDKLVLSRKEDADASSLLIHPSHYYTKNLEEVKLPKPKPPSINIIKHKERYKKVFQDAEREHRPLIDIGHDVAERAWERRTRLDRPGSMPKMKEKCSCPYCGTASPFQTHAYREIEQRHKFHIQQQRELEDEERKRLQEEREKREHEQKERREREELERQERQRLRVEEEVEEKVFGEVMDEQTTKYIVKTRMVRKTRPKPKEEKVVTEYPVPEYPAPIPEQIQEPTAAVADQGCACVIL